VKNLTIRPPRPEFVHAVLALHCRACKGFIPAMRAYFEPREDVPVCMCCHRSGASL